MTESAGMEAIGGQETLKEVPCLRVNGGLEIPEMRLQDNGEVLSVRVLRVCGDHAQLIVVTELSRPEFNPSCLIYSAITEVDL
jgi:hypothetical protein